MPIYELECTKCGAKEEKLFTRIVHFMTPAEIKKREREERERREMEADGWTIIDTTPEPKYPELRPKCGSCGGPQLLLPSLTNMQPDPYWSGQMVHGEYVTSKKQVKKREIAPATRDRMEWVEKQKAKAVADHKEKSDKRLRKFLTQQLSDITIEADGSSVKERIEYERARGRDYYAGTNE